MEGEPTKAYIHAHAPRPKSAKWRRRLIGAALVTRTASMVAHAQTGQLNLTPGQIFRFGDTRDMDCTVQLKFTGSLLTNANMVVDIRVFRAVDDRGKDLNERVAGRPWFGVSPLYNQPGRVPGLIGWRAVLPLKCPGESAKTIKAVSGEIDLAFPTEATGGLLRVANFMAHPGQVVAAPNLARQGVKLTFHSFESYVQFERAHPKKYVEDTVLKIERSCFSGILGSPTNPPRTSLAIAVEDPNRVLLGFAFETSDGKRVRATATCQLSGFRCYRFQQPPSSKLNLIVAVAAPGVVHTEPFRLADIELPWIAR